MLHERIKRPEVLASRSFLLQKRNEPKKVAPQSASSCVFFIEWGENFFRLFPFDDKYSGASRNGDKKTFIFLEALLLGF